MKQSHLNRYLSVVHDVCGSLQSCQSALSVYPAIQPLVMSMTCGLERLAREQIQLEAETALFGDTPWAKLYALQTGREVRIPQELKMVEYVGQSASHYRSYEYPLRDIVHCLLAKRDLETMDFSFATTLEDIAVTVTLTLTQEAQTAEITFANNDMVITLPDINSPRAAAMCPLFSEAYLLGLNMEWLTEHALQRLYDSLVPTPLRVVDADRLLEGLESESAKALAALLRSGDYRGNDTPTSPGERFTVAVPLQSKHRVYLGAASEYGNEPYLKVSRVERLHATERPNELYQWHKNSPLVQDLLDNIDRLVDQALSAHADNLPPQS